MEVHEKIKFLRLSKDWSQEDVAIKLEMSPNGYGCIERGETDVNLSRLKQIAKLFGVELSSLFDDGKNIFNLNGDAQYSGWIHNQNNSGFSEYSTEYLQLKSELEKQLFFVELKDKELAMKDREIAYLKELLELHKQQKSNSTE
jgi:transcriptional regulator with XRE-family HTH domain